MSFRVVNLFAEYNDVETGKRQVMVHIVADSVSDLPSNSGDLVWILGSTADVVDSGLRYMIDSNGVWISQGASDMSQAYTKQQVDNMLTLKQNVLTFDSTPISGSSNPVTSDGIYQAVQSSGQPFVCEEIYANPSGTEINQDYSFSNNHTLSEYKALDILLGNRNDSQATYGCGHYVFYIDAISYGSQNLDKVFCAGYKERWCSIQFTNTGFKVVAAGASGENIGYTTRVYAIYGISK